jgi:transposase
MYSIEFHYENFNPLSPELNPICYLLALLAHDLLHTNNIATVLLEIIM